MELQMEKHRSLSKEQQGEEQLNTTSTNGHKCPKCGASNDSSAAYCENCGTQLNAKHCPNCGAPMLDGSDFCEQCGSHIITDKCPFCGETMASGDAFCAECGAPRKGILCPACHQMSTFSFCKNCGTPLTSQARRELERVRQQPIYKQMEMLVQEFEELERVIPINTEAQVEREKRNQDLRRRVLELLNQGCTMARSKDVYGAGLNSESLEVLIQKKRQELQATLDRMEAPQLNNAAKARNYAMACRPGASKLGWMCNYKHAIHHSPCECAYPQLGGKWVINENNNTEGDIK